MEYVLPRAFTVCCGLTSSKYRAEHLNRCLAIGSKQIVLYCAVLGDMERVMGIEPTLPAWEADVLPLNYTRAR